MHASTCFCRRSGKPSLSGPSVFFVALSVCMCVYVVCICMPLCMRMYMSHITLSVRPCLYAHVYVRGCLGIDMCMYVNVHQCRDIRCHEFTCNHRKSHIYSPTLRHITWLSKATSCEISSAFLSGVPLLHPEWIGMNVGLNTASHILFLAATG